METRPAEAIWIQRAHEEAEENIKRKHQHGTGICSVFILDTSESMTGEGVRQMKTAFLDILNEYESLHLDDNIAVIGCGKEVKFLHYYSNNYYSIKKCLDKIHCEGASPLEAGIILSYSGIKFGGGHTAVIHPLHIRARVVVISDGNPTDLEMSSFIETSETTTDTKTFHRLRHIIESQGQINPFTFIPVGKDPNYCLLGELALATRGGRLIGWKDAREYARLSLYFNVAGKLLRMFPSEKITESIVRRECSMYGGGGEDINQICKILNEREVYGHTDDIVFDNNFKERYSNMPYAGTRVRRGRHWNYENQDSYGVGTVIGHSKRVGWLHVEWDNGRQFSYQFGYDGNIEEYDIQVCNEPRNIPETQEIAIGCLVRKGPHWQWGNQNGSEDSIGTVYRIKPRGEVYVRSQTDCRTRSLFVQYKNNY